MKFSGTSFCKLHFYLHCHVQYMLNIKTKYEPWMGPEDLFMHYYYFFFPFFLPSPFFICPEEWTANAIPTSFSMTRKANRKGSLMGSDQEHDGRTRQSKGKGSTWCSGFPTSSFEWYYLGRSLGCFQFLLWTAKKKINPMRFHFIVIPTNFRASSAKCRFLTKLKQRLFCRIVLTQAPLPRIQIRTFSFKSKTAFVSVVY